MASIKLVVLHMTSFDPSYRLAAANSIKLELLILALQIVDSS